ncbi:hypothetical protein LTR36_004491 [Oleoguttula mirabilis]|uniref:tRNA-intron lyase n=1 Tax=Oleoguttula mirabilis TaxID=1507867 RepID=A0AAV9JH51_9PEZI|nr:hypothetical protein LTR36_004491 [Oleoguttula mirabilis]
MSEHPGANGHPPETTPNPDAAANGTATKPDPTAQKRPRPPKKKGPNYAQIHSKPLPLIIHPLPAFHPSHPLSLLYLCYTYLSHLLSPPTSHLAPASHYTGYFSPETRSVHVTDPVHIRALWEMGFFGKGNLSRSEPSWLERERARVEARVRGGGTAEEATGKRREERRMFKLERARAERERIELQRAVEGGRGVVGEGEVAVVEVEVGEDVRPTVGREEVQTAEPESSGQAPAQDAIDRAHPLESTTQAEERMERLTIDSDLLDPASANTDETPLLQPAAVATPPTPAPAPRLPTEPEILEETVPDIPNQEHLQLTLEEAFFLSYGLGVLDIISPDDPTHTHPTRQPPNIPKPNDLLMLFTRHSVFPPLAASPLESPRPPAPPPAPDSPFLLHYAVYHHFRSLGWVVRPGVKFAVDYLLYNRGPVFSHAEFGVLVLPAYTHAYWRTAEGLRGRSGKGQRDWWWLHCVNRVQSQVRKTLVLCYVDVPPPLDGRESGGGGGGGGGSGGGNGEVEGNVSTLLRRYKVREFVLKRWLANRSRD